MKNVILFEREELLLNLNYLIYLESCIGLDCYVIWILKTKKDCGNAPINCQIDFSGLSSAQIYNRDVLIDALENRPPGVPLLTVANHHSCADEPLLWGKIQISSFSIPFCKGTFTITALRCVCSNYTCKWDVATLM